MRMILVIYGKIVVRTSVVHS